MPPHDTRLPLCKAIRVVIVAVSLGGVCFPLTKAYDNHHSTYALCDDGVCEGTNV